MADGGALSAVAFEWHGSKRCLRTFVPLASTALDAGKNSGWAHVAMLGGWEGHSSGPFQFTTDAFAQILKNFDAQTNPIPWDYEHDTFNMETTGPKPASGWVRQLELRANGSELWAYVDWTARAAQMIRDGEYRYCSPVVDFDSQNRRSNASVGAELLSVALTNNPFLDGQHPIQLTWVAAGFPPPDDKKLPPPHGQPGQSSPPHPGAQPQPPPQHGAPPPPPHGQPPHGAPPHGAPPPFPPKKDDQPPTAAAANPPPAQPNAAGQPPTQAEPPQPMAAADPQAAAAAVGDGSEADANALLTALADASGLDKTQTLAALVDMKDLLVQQIQKTVARDGTPAEARRTMTTEKKPETASQPAAATETTTPAPAVAAPAIPPPGSLSLDELEKQNDKAVIKQMAERLAAIEAERAAEKQAQIAQLVDDKIKTGHIPLDQRDNAIWAFTQDRARAEQIYAHKVIALGVRQTTATPGTSVPGTATAHNADGQLDVSQFSRAELLTIDCLIGAHKTQQQAVAIVLKRRSHTN